MPCYRAGRCPAATSNTRTASSPDSILDVSNTMGIPISSACFLHFTASERWNLRKLEDNKGFCRHCFNLPILVEKNDADPHGDGGMDWIIHFDTDELIHPAAAQRLLIEAIAFTCP